MDEKAQAVVNHLSDLDNKMNSLQNLFSIYQQNINNDITWFLAGLTLVAAILIGALVIWVKSIVQASFKMEYDKIDRRIRRIVNENNPLYFANGSASVQTHNLIQISGLLDFSPDKFISVLIYNSDGIVVSCAPEKITKDNIDIRLNEPVADFRVFYWNICWRK